MEVGIFKEVRILKTICNHFVLIQTICPTICIENSCKTPDNWDGKCIVLQQCRPLYNLLLQGSMITMEQRTFLRNSQCGRQGSNPLVCCPNTFTIDDLPSNKLCGVQVSDKIVGGDETSINDFPWYAFNQSMNLLNLYII